MQRYTKLEISVGLFVVAGVMGLGYLSMTLGGFELQGPRYSLRARFASVGDLKLGDPVKLAGVVVGDVTGIQLVDYSAEVQLSLRAPLPLPDDSIASIQTAGLLGDAYVSLSPGASDQDLAPGGSIRRTEPAITISELISKYAFGTLEPGPAEEHPPADAEETSKTPFEPLQ